MRRLINIFGNFDSKDVVLLACCGDVNDRGQIVDSPGGLGEEVYEEIEKQIAEGKEKGELLPRANGRGWPVTWSWEIENPVADAIVAVLSIIDSTYPHNSNGERCDGDPDHSGADIVAMLCDIEAKVVEAAVSMGVLPDGYGAEGEPDDNESSESEYMDEYMANMAHIAPAYRFEPTALRFGKFLRERCCLQPEQLGSGYAWETSIPPEDQWERIAATLNAEGDTN